MRILIMHTDHRKIRESVELLQRALEQEGVRIDTVSPQSGSSLPISTASYGLICVVSEFTGWWKPRIPTEMDSLLKRATRLEGKRGSAFVPAKLLGSNKALRVLMALMEHQGVIVSDFGALGKDQQLATIAKRLKRLA